MYVYTGYVYTKLNSNRILRFFGVKNFYQAIKLVGNLPLFDILGILLEGVNFKESRREIHKSGAHFSINGT